LSAGASGRTYSAPTDPIAIFRGPTSKGREGGGERREGKGGRVDREMRGEWREGVRPLP